MDFTSWKVHYSSLHPYFTKGLYSISLFLEIQLSHTLDIPYGIPILFPLDIPVLTGELVITIIIVIITIIIVEIQKVKFY